MAVSIRASDLLVSEVTRQIEALFGAARPAVGHERCAYVQYMHRGALERCSFIVIANGEEKAEGAPIKSVGSMRDAGERAIRTVKRLFPDAKQQCLIWRCPPQIDHSDAARVYSRRYGLKEQVATDWLYMRLGAIPLTVEHTMAWPEVEAHWNPSLGCP